MPSPKITGGGSTKKCNSMHLVIWNLLKKIVEHGGAGLSTRVALRLQSLEGLFLAPGPVLNSPMAVPPT